MKSSALFGVLALTFHLAALWAAPDCDPSDPAFVCGLNNPEDLVRLPGTPWVIATAINFTMANPPYDFGPGPLSAIHIDTRSVQRLYPAADGNVEWDSKTFPDCSAPPQIFSSHGLNVRPLGGKKFRLYAVNHGGRESVEIIDVAVWGERLRSTWRGCVPVSMRDLGIWPNAVAPLPGGGFVLAGYNVAIWQPGRGWEKFHSYEGMKPGAPGGTGLANGVEVSRDSKWIFIADTERNSVIRVPLGGGEQTVLKLTFTPDNLRWGEDGRLYVNGPVWPKSWKTNPEAQEKCYKQPICVTGIGIASIDPQTLAVKDVLHNEDGIKDKFGTPTTALQVGDYFWIGTSRGDRVAILAIKP